MKKLLLILAIVVGGAMLFSSLGAADIVNFPITVTVPQATGVNIVAVSVLSEGNVFGTTPVTSFNFNPLSPTTSGVWLPDHYYAVDVGVTGGTGSTNITLRYIEGTRPTGQPLDNSLGYKTTASFFSITGGPAPEDQVSTPLATSVGTKALLINLASDVTITPLLLNGGFFRAYIGVYPGGDATLTDGKPFTNADVPGTYTGTLRVTATVA
ncbi:MAG: hypothetical protein JW847_01900 [Candidatus Omnitrophica bacterium]|nr:hypothetical protein [Candidatus Omnitrophota bacterium]